MGASGHVYSSKDSFSAASFLYYVDDKNIKKDAGAFIEANPSKFFAVVSISKILIRDIFLTRPSC